MWREYPGVSGCHGNKTTTEVWEQRNGHQAWLGGPELVEIIGKFTNDARETLDSTVMMSFEQ